MKRLFIVGLLALGLSACGTVPTNDLEVRRGTNAQLLTLMNECTKQGKTPVVVEFESGEVEVYEVYCVE